MNKNISTSKKINSNRSPYLTTFQNVNYPIKKLSILNSINAHIQKDDKYNPVDLICISFKSKLFLKDSLIQSLKLNKIKFRNPIKYKFIIDNLKESLIIEINITEDEEIPNAHIFKIKRIRGTNYSYSKLTRFILTKVDF